MIYLDYSATTPVNNIVLQTFQKYSLFSEKISLEEEKQKIRKILDCELDIIFTSGATEANNYAIKGILDLYENQSVHIITTKLEHSSISETLSYYQKKGFNIDYVNLIDGVVDITHLKSLITDKTVLVAITAVNSEIGLNQPINEIGKILKEYPHITFLSDFTQAIGKIDVKLDNVDLAIFSAHKFYGLKGIGVLLKRKEINLPVLIHGPRKINKALVKSLTKALELAYIDLDRKYNYVLSLNNKIKNNLTTYENVRINSNENCIPHILNISILSAKPETFQHLLDQQGVYISTKTACSSDKSLSEGVYALTKDETLAKTSLRISISPFTTEEEINNFLLIFSKCYKSIL